MKIFRSLVGIAVAATLWAQQPIGERQATPRGGGGQAGSGAPLTILVMYPEGVFSEAQARAWEQNLHGFIKIEVSARGSDWHSVRTGALLEAMLYGLEPAAAGAARAAAPAWDAPRANPSGSIPEGETLGRVFGTQGNVAGFVLKQSGGNQTCPPADCGCDKRTITCYCALLKKKGEPEFCLCTLCPPKPLPLDTLGRAGGRSLIILVTDDLQTVPKLTEAARNELRQMGPATGNLVIKTKSSPP